jgi:hypothetical protein
LPTSSVGFADLVILDVFELLAELRKLPLVLAMAPVSHGARLADQVSRQRTSILVA